MYEGEEVPLRDLRIVIDKEKDPPITETPCL